MKNYFSIPLLALTIFVLSQAAHATRNTDGSFQVNSVMSQVQGILHLDEPTLISTGFEYNMPYIIFELSGDVSGNLCGHKDIAVSLLPDPLSPRLPGLTGYILRMVSTSHSLAAVDVGDHPCIASIDPAKFKTTLKIYSAQYPGSQLKAWQYKVYVAEGDEVALIRATYDETTKAWELGKTSSPRTSRRGTRRDE